MFLSPWFVLAGVIAATGPVIIHLLNRRRFRVVEWAAMDFLREAMHRSRRILHLRDLVLLALRTLCVLLFGFAMARPFLHSSAATIDPDQPVHAVLLVDNSLSMAYEKFDSTLLDEAKTKAKELIEGLPRGSRISVLPTCGSATGFSFDAYYTKEDALEALGAIKIVDRETKAHETIDLALEACRRLPDMGVRRVVLFTDKQVERWPTDSLEEHVSQVPGGIEKEIVDAGEVENAWISDFRILDGVADLQVPVTFMATVNYQGGARRLGVPVKLIVEGQTIAEQSIDLEPGQRREIEFPPCRLDVAVERGKVGYATAEVAMEAHDKLPADDRRFLTVPVVSSLPVVFVDELGGDENVKRMRIGQTYPLRCMVAPTSSQAVRDRQLFEVRHIRIDELERSLLEDARLVVVAGSPNPGSDATVTLLREYVEQGGNLIIAAGAEFDPGAWSEAAWLRGRGVLPVPLGPAPVGKLPTEGQLEPFQLEFEGLKDQPYFAIENLTKEELLDLYTAPYFFKAVVADVSSPVKELLEKTVTEDAQERAGQLAEIDRRLATLSGAEAKRGLGGDERQEQADLEQQRARIEPNWLHWKNPDREVQEEQPSEQVPADAKVAVLARYTNGHPYMVERRIGRGRVLLVTTSLFSDWNTLCDMKTVAIYDRIVRTMLGESLPERNVATGRRMVLPVSLADRNARFTLVGPNEQEEPLTVDALGPNRFGVTVPERMQRGIYRVAAVRARGTAQDGLEAKIGEVPLAVNGPAEESELVAPAEADLRQRSGGAAPLQTADSAALILERSVFQERLLGVALWKWLLASVLACLLAELTVLAWPSLRGSAT